jgi:hypothetical protein
MIQRRNYSHQARKVGHLEQQLCNRNDFENHLHTILQGHLLDNGFCEQAHRLSQTQADINIATRRESICTSTLPLATVTYRIKVLDGIQDIGRQLFFLISIAPVLHIAVVTKRSARPMNNQYRNGRPRHEGQRNNNVALLANLG